MAGIDLLQVLDEPADLGQEIDVFKENILDLNTALDFVCSILISC